jgi:hypothetical protein
MWNTNDMSTQQFTCMVSTLAGCTRRTNLALSAPVLGRQTIDTGEYTHKNSKALDDITELAVVQMIMH